MSQLPVLRITPRDIAATLLALLLALGLPTGVSARKFDNSRDKQEGDGLVVTITHVDSQSFPQVMAYVTVSDADGWPLGILTATDFRVLEDGNQVPAASIVVEMKREDSRREDSQDLGLVLALDVSTPGATLDRIQEAAKSLVDALGPQDEMAIIIFSDNVQVAQDLTTSKDELRATIDGLEPGGGYTALNEAILEAATMAGALSPGRNMVVVVTDSQNNIGSLSAADAVNKALESGVLVHTIGLGPKVEPQALEDIARLTGGQSQILSGSEEVEAGLQALEVLPRLGYWVIFPSGLQADDAEHDLSISVTHAGAAGEAQIRFTAVPGEVSIALLDTDTSLPITDGQTVGGVINLAAEVTAPAPIASVEYLLDGKLLTKLYSTSAADNVPYGFDWDSTTVEPGVYTLTVKAKDSACNAGEIQARLIVVPPVAVRLLTPPQEVVLGDRITVEAEVDALAEVVGVEFLLDGKVLGSDDTPPYRFSFDSGTYPVGEYVVTVRAEDGTGHGDRASASVQFLAPPEPQPEREGPKPLAIAVAIATGIVAVAIGIVVAVSALRATLRWQKRRYQKVCRLEIENRGNIQSRYQLLAETETGGLRFQFTLDGVTLHQNQQQVVSVQQPTVDQPVPSGSPPRLDMGKVQGTASRVRGVGYGIANLLGTVGTLLPASVGAPLRRLAGQLRQQQAAVSRAEQMPRQMALRTKRLTGPRPRTGPSAPSSRAATAPVQVASRGAVTAPLPGASVAHTAVSAWAQTPFVGPGETLTVDLLIDPIERPLQTQRYPFTVSSRAVEQENGPLRTEEGSVRIAAVSWLGHYVFPFIPFLALILIELGLLSLLFEILVQSIGAQ
jgi:VWFA-related protein